MLLENPKGDNRLDLLKLKSAVSSIFGLNDTELAVFHGDTGMWKVEGYLWTMTGGGLVNVFIWYWLCYVAFAFLLTRLGWALERCPPAVSLRAMAERT